ncbi:MAG: universal stress protein [Rhodococcus sp. (in: high G+C Gram-positive bacteria)]|uniref:universal stress protein n=1 Tax=Rhodococcus sp. TaxID=1831 RepID=UPI003BB1CD84
MSVLAHRQSIVVGVDGSEMSTKAALWAAAVADRRSAPLHLAHALPNPGYHYSEAALLFQAEFTDAVRKSAEDILDRAEKRVAAQFPDLRVARSTHPGPAGLALVGLSKQADLVVVGYSGAGAVGSLLTGSTVLRVVNHAHCAVTVFKSEGEWAAPDHRPVVVGVDGSELSQMAIAEATEFASLFDVQLLAVHGWGAGDYAGRQSALTMVNWAVVEEEQRVLMAENLAGWKDKYPDLGVTSIVEQENAARLMLRHAEDAQLIVVGSHGRNRLSGAILGSTSQNLLHNATCPVMICRHAD